MNDPTPEDVARRRDCTAKAIERIARFTAMYAKGENRTAAQEHLKRIQEGRTKAKLKGMMA